MRGFSSSLQREILHEFVVFRLSYRGYREGFMIATLPQILHFDGSNQAECQFLFHVKRLAMQTIPNDVP